MKDATDPRTSYIAEIRRQSTAALEVVARSKNVSGGIGRVCWHCASLTDYTHEDDTAFFERINELIYAKIPDGLFEPHTIGIFEVWEERMPTKDWIEGRLDQFLELTKEGDFLLEGWSFEPDDRRFAIVPQAWGHDDNEAIAN